MHQTVGRMIRVWGRPVTVRRGTEVFTLRGLVQPVTSHVERLALVQMGPLGRESRERFICISPTGTELQPDDRLESCGKRYVVRSAQLVWAGEKPLYCWAMCVREGSGPV